MIKYYNSLYFKICVGYENIERIYRNKYVYMYIVNVKFNFSCCEFKIYLSINC